MGAERARLSDVPAASPLQLGSSPLHGVLCHFLQVEFQEQWTAIDPRFNSMRTDLPHSFGVHWTIGRKPWKNRRNPAHSVSQTLWSMAWETLRLHQPEISDELERGVSSRTVEVTSAAKGRETNQSDPATQRNAQETHRDEQPCTRLRNRRNQCQSLRDTLLRDS